MRREEQFSAKDSLHRTNDGRGDVGFGLLGVFVNFVVETELIGNSEGTVNGFRPSAFFRTSLASFNVRK